MWINDLCSTLDFSFGCSHKMLQKIITKWTEMKSTPGQISSISRHIFHVIGNHFRIFVHLEPFVAFLHCHFCRGFMTLRRSIVYRWIFFYWNGFFGNSTKLLNKLIGVTQWNLWFLLLLESGGAFVFDAAETIASQSIWWASIRLGFFFPFSSNKQ